MAEKYSFLAEFIRSRIYDNDQEAITGQITQEAFLALIADLGKYSQFGGIAALEGDPETGDAPVIFLADKPGTYTNFGGLTVEEGEVAMLVYDGAEWGKETLGVLSSAPGAVKEANIADDAVTENKIKNGSVIENKIGEGAVSESKISDDAVTENKIKDGAVSENKLADDAVTTDKVKDGAVTYPKLNIPSALLVGMVLQNVQEGVIEAQSNHYYNIAEDVDALTVTLPTPFEQRTDRVAFHFVAGSHPSLVIDGGEVPVFRSGVSPKPHKEYIVTCFYNGVAWNVSADCITPSDCITFQSADPFTLTILRKGWDGSFEYSTDANTWHEVEIDTAIESASNGLRNVLYLRGHGNTTISNFTLVGVNDAFMTMEGANIHCVGDIRTLLNYKDATTASLGSRSFLHFFDDCAALVSAPELPSLILAEECYRKMFYGTGITIAPELPAMTLAESCYDHMFGLCTALTKAPKLPATTLAYGCYCLMFNGCTAITSAPELPATILAESCYQGMFNDCKITTAPVLPVTTLAKGCYGGMFRGCTELVNAPELPATTLAEDCYREMFLRCSSLTTAPEISATAVDKNCCNSMFGNCTALVNPPSILPAMVLAQECYRSMFNGCTALENAPELPATTLAESCYRGMFIDCTAITSAPELPATTLVKECYRTMFQRCTMLTAITMLATDITAADCLLNWLNGVAAEGVITKAAAMVSLPSGASGIPNGWTTVDA